MAVGGYGEFMRFRMKVAASFGFISVVAFFIFSGTVDFELVTSSIVGAGVVAVALGLCISLISYYFDKNYNSDGTKRVGGE